ncbi:MULTISPECIES: EF-hand domain-containing protein [unclassified Sphingomonas]|uniref:EF-hand domain-containing protein n=1 Tax=unclassified Sphingomonas TaxID=196159 RepID=UPI000E102399|nr:MULTISPECIES: EF-hand domain-containing protein [unclassified Sphingomonas]AXJ96823.1 EF-hand domain-containing protein [Sphingomonas sp. FARSPH]
MLKYALLAGAMTIAAPALAQTATDQTQAQPGRTPIAPTDPATVKDQTAQTQQPAQTVDPATPADQTAPQTTSAQTAQTQPDPAATSATGDATATAAAQPATGTQQVASIVDTEFPSYDANKDGQLTRAEFDDWMLKLKEKSDPSATPDSPATKKWLGAAFTQADKDRNKQISKAELLGFLTQGKS